jgi:putative ABC transport system substrate-binding protein
MRRRAFLFLPLALTAPAAAQTTGERIYRLGVLAQPGLSLGSIRSATLPELARLGFSEGRNLVVDARVGEAPALPDLARELLLAHPDAIIASGGLAIDAARGATTTVPIIGFAAEQLQVSLARPGGNVTGVVLLQAALDGKRLDLLHEAVPQAHRIAALHQRTGAITRRDSDREMGAVAARAGVELLTTFEADGPEDYPAAFAAMRAAGAQALVITGNPRFFRDAGQLAALAAATGLPTACEWAEMARSGCLLGYGPRLTELRRRLADYAAQIFRGARPGDLPIETPTHFDFTINLRTARTLGLAVPPSLLIRADEVIE